MTTRIVYLFLIVLFSYCSLSSQDYSVDWGPELRREGGIFSAFYLLGFTDDNQYHLVMRPRKSNTLLSFNLEHRLINTQSLNLSFDREDMFLDRFVETTAGHFAYFMHRNKREDQWEVLISPFTKYSS